MIFNRKKLILSTKSKIKDAIKLLNGDYGNIIVILKNKKVNGLLTEGDLRRNLLKGYSLEDPINNIINKNFFYIYESDLKNTIKLKEKIQNANFDLFFSFPLINKKKELLKVIQIDKNNFLNKIQTKFLFTNQKYLKKPFVLIVGGGGFIGSNLVKQILDKGWKVRVVDKFLYDKKSLNQFKKNKNLELVKGDICDFETQIKSIDNINCVVFLAEIVGDPSVKAKPLIALKTNFLALNSMASLCANFGISRFIYTSSCSVYGYTKDDKHLLNEESFVNPQSYYARIKLFSENSLLNIRNKNFNPTILRLGTVFGQSYRQRYDLVVNTFCKAAHIEKKISVFGGDQWRPNIHVTDVSRAIIHIIGDKTGKSFNQIFNLSNDNLNMKINDLAKIVVSNFNGSKLKINKKITDKRNYRVSSKKIRDLLNFEAKVDLDSGIKEIKSFFKKNSKYNLDQKIYSNYETLKDEYK